MNCTCNGINVHELISLSFNTHIGAGRGGSMGGTCRLCHCGTIGMGVLMQLWDSWHTVLSLILSRTDQGVTLVTVQGTDNGDAVKA